MTWAANWVAAEFSDSTSELKSLFSGTMKDGGIFCPLIGSEDAAHRLKRTSPCVTSLSIASLVSATAADSRFDV